MTHKIQSIIPLDDFVLLATFNNGVEKKYDIKQLYKVFPQFTDVEKINGLFQQVKVDTGGYGVSWNDSLDLDSEEIWDNGTETGNKIEVAFSEAERVRNIQKHLNWRTRVTT